MPVTDPFPRRAFSAPADPDSEALYSTHMRRVPTNHVDSCCVTDEGPDHDPNNDENHEDRDGEQTPVEDPNREVVAKRERSRIDEVQADLSPEERRWKDDIVT